MADATDPPAEPDLPLNPDTAKAIAEQAIRSYDEEAERSKILDTKTGLLLGATGTVITLSVGTLARLPAAFDEIPRGAQFGALAGAYYLFLASALALLGFAARYFLDQLNASLVPYVRPDSLTQPAWFVQEPATFHRELADAYTRARRGHVEVMRTREGCYTSGQRCFTGGLVCLVVVVFVLSAVSLMYPGRPAQERSLASDERSVQQTR